MSRANDTSMRSVDVNRSIAVEKKIVIICAGPTGLGAAYRLKELGYKNFQAFEKSPHIGGLASSFTDSAGYTWDIGGHVMVAHDKHDGNAVGYLMGNDVRLN